jgi:uncharacterized protein
MRSSQGRIAPGIALLALLAWGAAAFGQDYPERKGLVNDYAGVLSSATARRMENLSRELLQKTGATVAVAVVTSLQGLSVEQYATGLYEKWGIGRKGEDRGVLLLVSTGERRVRIEVGYGLEGILPDGKVGGIRDDYIVPYLSKGDYDTGLLAGCAALAQVIAEDAGVTLTGGVDLPRRPERRSSGSPFSIIAVIVLFLLLGRSRILPWILLSTMLGGGRGRYGGGFGSFGGGFGSFGGGGGGGGGFSGFGGGMSGGGGASGSF